MGRIGKLFCGLNRAFFLESLSKAAGLGYSAFLFALQNFNSILWLSGASYSNSKRYLASLVYWSILAILLPTIGWGHNSPGG